MWEIFTCGSVPYAGVHVMGILKELREGGRLEKPSNAACHDDMLVDHTSIALTPINVILFFPYSLFVIFV